MGACLAGRDGRTSLSGPAAMLHDMQRSSLLAIGSLSFAASAAALVGAFASAPRTLGGEPRSATGRALLVDLALLCAFALQHSGMARGAFKAWLARRLPRELERSVYVLASSLALLALCAAWEPLAGVVWHVEARAARAVLFALCGFGLVLVLVSAAFMDPLELFGIAQLHSALRGEPYEPPRFRTPGPYRFVRHPLYLGVLMALWSAPTLSASRLLVASAATLYVLIALRLEERDLLHAHGSAYAAYRQTVPALLPRIRNLVRGAGNAHSQDRRPS